MTWISRNLSISIAFIFIMFPDSYASSPYSNTTANMKIDQRMGWWQDAKFGIFISWGPVALTGEEMGWTRGGRRADRGQDCQPKAGEAIPARIYDNLYKQFNPNMFNAREWIDVVKLSGAKYIIFITKHHDGFCLFDTKLTDYKITSPLSPFGKDVTAEIARASHEAGIKIFWYYSPTDWYQPDFFAENHKNYLKYLYGQVEELCTNYGKIDGIWFDDQSGVSPDSEEVSKLIWSLQPQAIINNRYSRKQTGDFDTPEQAIGRFQTDRPWESCITLGTQWSWRPQDNLKSLKQCITILVQCVGGGGNLALNTAPMPDGRLEQRQVDRLKQIGQWLEKYGQSIYEARGGPFKPCSQIASTHKDNIIFLHIFRWKDNDVKLPPINKKIISATVLTGGTAEFKQSQTEIVVSVTKEEHQEIDTIVQLTLDGPAEDIKPVNLPSGSMAYAKEAAASSTYGKEFSADKAFDDDDNTRWAAADSNEARKCWLQLDLGRPKIIAMVKISEYENKIQSYELQQEVGHEWKTFYSGTTIGLRAVIKLPSPITTQKIRFSILESNANSPSISEFQLFDSEYAELFGD
jgi:alpha-L-fucosidase